MVLRRTRRAEEPALAAPRPSWREPFDEAAAMIRSRPHPAWIDDRLVELENALDAAHHDIEALSGSIDQLDPDRTTAQLKDELRRAQGRLPTEAADGGRRLATLRRRHEAVNDLMNRRQQLAQRMADSIADLELLAVESVRSDAAASTGAGSLEDHLRRLDIDLTALAAAREELRSL